MQQLLKALRGAARAEVVPTELLGQFLVAVDDLHASLDLGLRRVSPSPLAHRLEKNGRLWNLLDRMGHLLWVEWTIEKTTVRENGSASGLVHRFSP